MKTVPMKKAGANEKRWRVDPNAYQAPNGIIGVFTQGDHPKLYGLPGQAVSEPLVRYSGADLGLPFDVFLPPGEAPYGPANIPPDQTPQEGKIIDMSPSEPNPTSKRTAAGFAEASVRYSNEAEHMRPQQGDDYSHAMSLIVYHLRAAATKAREVAEQLAGAEQQKEAANEGGQ